MGFLRLLASRILQLFLTLFFLITVTFFASHLIPSDPAEALAGPYASKAVLDSIIRQYGLNKPLWYQYLIYFSNLLHGNLGKSLVTGRPVLADIELFFPVTAQLAITATIIGVSVGTLLGVFAAMYADRWPGVVASIASLIGYSLPVFWLALLFQIFFGVDLHLLPVSGYIDPAINVKHITGMNVLDSILTGNVPGFESSFEHLIMPAVVLSFAELGIIAKFVRGTMLDVLSQEYVRTAKAFGFSSRTVNYRYALKNTMIPVVTHIGLDFGAIFGYTVLVETVFAYPGIGYYLSRAILSVDFNAIIGCTIVLGTIVILTNFVVDILYGAIDPRIRYGSRDSGGA